MKNKKKKRLFLKEKGVIKRLTILSGMLLAIATHVGFFYAINGEVINFSDAYNAVQFSQSILPFDPVKEVKEIVKSESNRADYSSSVYRVTKPINQIKPKEEIVKPQTVVSPIVTLTGRGAFPNSQVLLAIHSEPFLTSVQTDANGKWTWTNYAQPLEEGEHTIEMLNISPYELSGKRDIFSDKYSFVVSEKNNSIIQTLDLQSDGDKKETNRDDVGDLFSKNNVQGIYLFDALFLNKKTYIPGETIDLQMIFSDLGAGSPQDAKITYEIFALKEDSLKLEKAMEALDNVVLENDNSFFKQIVLKDELIDGEYVFKITADVTGKKYIQNMRFSVADKEVVRIGSVVMTREKLNMALVWNTLVLLVVVTAMLIVIIFEYKRFISIGPIDEHLLKKRGYFS